MRRSIVGVLAGVMVVGGAGLASAAGVMFFAAGTGSQEVPANLSTAEAKLNLRIGPSTDTAAYTLRITEPIQNVTQSHLHRGGVGVNGPVAVWLYPVGPPAQLIPGTTQGLLARGQLTPESLCWSPTAPYCVDGEGDWDGFVAAVQAGDLYLNVHTSQLPAGEVRGQVTGAHQHG